MKHKVIQRQSLWLTFLLFVVFFVGPLTNALASVTITTPTDYVVANLQVGDEYYLDRIYTLTSIPSELAVGEEEWIKTKKKDKANTSDSFLEFTISQDSTIYIGYDTRATSPPDWLTSKFVSTPLIIGVSEVMGHFDVYKQNFSAGTITLGGNLASGAAGAKSNYIAIVKPYATLPEICSNGLDDDLDSLIDCADADCSADPACQTCTDADLDGYYAESDCGTAVDCDDNDPAVNPGAVEVCTDAKDNDCDGAVDCADADCSADPACQTCTDADLDGYYAESDCGTAVDCDDNDPAVNPGAVEVCTDAKDNDCDGAVDCADADCSADPACQTCTDADLDGYYAESDCGTAVDCDDNDPAVNPGAVEVCTDAKDNDCDGAVDCADADCQEDIACLDNVIILNPADYEIANLQEGDEYYEDRTYTLNFIPTELSNGVEEWIKTWNRDKGNTTEENFLVFDISQASTVYIAYHSQAGSLPYWLSNNFKPTSLIIETDNSPFGLKQFNVHEQTFPAGTVTLGGNLASGAIDVPAMYFVIVKPYTPVSEVCNNLLDDDADGFIDCADADCSADPACQTCTDADLDGYYAESDCGTAVDCDDNDPAVNPGAVEVCTDAKDNDCDGAVDCADADCSADPACQTCTDADSDGYYAQSDCGTAVDCDDNDSAVNPGAVEVCTDAKDNDCDGAVDCADADCSADPACQTCTDADSDGYYAQSDCGTAVDCDDNDPAVNPGAVEVCTDAKDNDCDGAVDCADADCQEDIACLDNVIILNPADYEIANLQEGDEYYEDRTYTLNFIPTELSNGVEEWIKTWNRDKGNTTEENFLVFDISQASTVYIAYHSQAGSLPYWLSNNFKPTSLIIETDNSPFGLKQFNVHEQTFPAGTVTLGGNLASGAIDVPAMYFVIVKPYTPVSEVCNNLLDDDADGFIDCADADCSADPACQTCTDADLDGYYAESDCGTAVDCDDNDSAVNPGAVEVCTDAKDNDCDGAVDCADADCSADPACQTCTDADLDGYYAESDCGTAVDCDDNDSAVNPGAVEVCTDAKDNDCDGAVDCADADCSADPACQTCTDADLDGYYAESDCGTAVDCDDNDPAVNPGAVEVCTDAKDNDCDGAVDCADADCSADPACQTCTDADLDGYYAESDCGTAVDCDDNDPAVNPGAVEVCTDAKDNDCDGAVDCADADCQEDIACLDNVIILNPADYEIANLQEGDEYYEDRTYTLNFIPTELSNGVEEWIKTWNRDKGNTTEENFLVFDISQASTVYIAYHSQAGSLPYWLSNNFKPTSLIIETDNSPFGLKQFNVHEQTFPAGTVTLGGNLASGAIDVPAMYFVIVKPYTPVSEVCNNLLDDDADGFIDCADADCSADPACQTCTDADLDGYYAESDCGTAVDCDDNDPAVNPGAVEVCTDAKDNDCDGAVDCADADCSADPACQTCTDADLDGYYAESDCGTAVDCDDNDPAVNPGAVEVCTDAKDNDCDGAVDCADADCSADPACQTCTDADSDGYYAQSDCGTAVDCDDNDPAVNPGAVEVCTDAKDNDCDGAVDCADADCAGDPYCGGGTLPFSDDFEDGNANGWVVVDDENVSSIWEVVNGEYFQQNTINNPVGYFHDQNQTSYHTGTFSYLSGWSWLTDYRFSVKIISVYSTEEYKYNGWDVGVMFRYQDSDNYYRLSLNSRYGYTRFEKKVNGIFSTFDIIARGYKKAQVLDVLVELVSDKILVYLNNEPLFSVKDGSLMSGTVAFYSGGPAKFDDVHIEANNTSPAIVISKPNSHSVEVSDTLDVSAVALNVQGGGVEFHIFKMIDQSLWDQAPGNESPPGSSFFEAQLSSVPQGEYRMDAVIVSGGYDLSTDTNTYNGVSGDYYLTIGDSILNGIGDFFSLDGITHDERIIAFQGHQSILNDLLITDTGYPSIIFNEAVPGDETAQTLPRINSIIERHRNSDLVFNANKAFILLGTNDAGDPPVDSGLGCIPGGTDCDGTYKGNLLEIIGTLETEGIENENVTVVRIPPIFAPSANYPPFADLENAPINLVVQEYNQVILEIRNDPLLPNIEVGPDLFNFFKNRYSLFAERLHPNALGTVVLGYLLFDPSENMLPFFLENLIPSRPEDYPSLYKQTLLEVSNRYYIDRSYRLIGIPEELKDGICIMTANDDKGVTSDNHISFDVDRPCTVYIAYHSQAGSLPYWLSNNFKPTSLIIEANNSPWGLKQFNVHEQTFPAGTVTLGGNLASGAIDVPAMYFVIVKP